MNLKPTDLYGMFHNEVLKLATVTPEFDCDVWEFLPIVNIGRMQTVALIRKFMKQMSDDYPTGVTRKNGRFQITPMMVEFHKTHEDMGSSYQERIGAWKAMIGLSQ